MNVQIRNLPDYQVAYLRHAGPHHYDSIRILFNQLLFWAQKKNLLHEKSVVLGVIQKNRNFMSVKKNCFDACITIPKGFKDTNHLSVQRVRGGMFAVYSCEVANNDFKKPWNDLIYKWLIPSGYRPDKRPGFIIYHNNAQELPEKKWKIDICLSIKPYALKTFPMNEEYSKKSMAICP